MSALNKQVAGNHYKSKAIQPIEYIHANDLNFIEGSIVKYITRWRDKGGFNDLEKIKHYVDLLMELENKRIEREMVDGKAVVEGNAGSYQSLGDEFKCLPEPSPPYPDAISGSGVCLTGLDGRSWGGGGFIRKGQAQADPGGYTQR